MVAVEEVGVQNQVLSRSLLIRTRTIHCGAGQRELQRMLWTTLTSTTLWDLVGLETVWQILDQAHARLIGDKLDAAFENWDSARRHHGFFIPESQVRPASCW